MYNNKNDISKLGLFVQGIYFNVAVQELRKVYIFSDLIVLMKSRYCFSSGQVLFSKS